MALNAGILTARSIPPVGPQESQAWLARRFRGLIPMDFQARVRFYAPPPLVCPKNFETHWHTYDGTESEDEPLILPEVSAAINALVFIADPMQDAHLRLLQLFIARVDQIGNHAPPMVWMPHTTNPEVWPQRHKATQMYFLELLPTLHDMGLDGVLPGEPEGFPLALHVRAFIKQTEAITTTLMQMVNESRSRTQHAEFLRECMAGMIWDYLRIRMAPIIPPINFDIAPTETASIDGYEFTELLGRGSCGQVYRIKKAGEAQDPHVGQCMKVVSKHTVTTIRELKCTKRSIEVMQFVSKPEHRHPNIVQMYDLYHSQTHLFFRLEYAGPENLYRRLVHRQKAPPSNKPLSPAAAQSIFSQAVKALTHLHMSPSVCHRDIKPENFVVLETPDNPPVLKLADFDLALVGTEDMICRDPSGTFPFSAPEIIIDREYNPFSADIWSLGVTLMEVCCGVRVVERIFQINLAGGAAHAIDVGVMMRIQSAFEVHGSAGEYLEQHIRNELRIQPLLQVVVQLLNGALVPVWQQRWRAPDLVQMIQPLDA